MDETLDKMAERFKALEDTVSQGFAHTRSRFHEAEQRDAALSQKIDANEQRTTALEVTMARGFLETAERDAALSRKIDVNTESLRADIQTVAESVTAVAAEMRRTTESIRREHAADREILRLSILNHERRIGDLETSRTRP